MSAWLEFEKPVLELEQRIEELKTRAASGGAPGGSELAELERRADALRREVYAGLTPYQRVQVAKHPQRPYTLDYIERCCTEWTELHGDRHFGEDAAIVGGLALLDDRPIMVIGHQKGRGTKENLARRFGMPNPEGYRKALRLMQLADRFDVPVVTLVDTPGAYPGLGAEERGQAEAIAVNLREMAKLGVPIVTAVIGEGGSGGALAIAVSDQVIMFENSVYSVISPEGCAAILWKSAENAGEAAESLGITATRLKSLGVIDKVVNEPLGGAHRDHADAAKNLKKAIQDSLRSLQDLSAEELLERRQERWVNYGKFKELAE